MKTLALAFMLLLSGSSIFAQFTEPVTAEGDILVLSGRVVDANGSVVQGSRVEIWQTDSKGVYDHPGDPDTAMRDRGFQFFGNSIVDSEGQYIFRTVLPGEYEPRPRHIHVKVWRADTLLLTTQFYFAPDNTTYGNTDSRLRVLLKQERVNDVSVLTGEFDLIVNRGGVSGTLPLTITQQEGPYYPVKEVSRFDNDLASVE